MRFFIQTLGCAMNYSDSERVGTVLRGLGHTAAAKEREADLFIFNTCSIRQKGEDRVYGKLMDLGERKKSQPELLIGITGCMVRKTTTKNSPREELDKLVRDLKPVDFVFRIEDAGHLGKLLAEVVKVGAVKAVGIGKPKIGNKSLRAQTNTNKKADKKAIRFFDPVAFNRLDYLDIVPAYSSDFQAFVPIQIGCDKFCTYCIVPYARGREQARPMEDILKECEELVENGCKEITLVGQTVNSYGRSDLDKKSGHAYSEGYPAAKRKQFAKEPFVALLNEVDKLYKKGLNRLRFTSPHPYDYSDALILAHKKLKTLAPHFHIPVQAGSDETLKRMNRRYTVDDYRKMVAKIRKLIPNASVTTDIIVGFCGESKKDFNETLRLYKEIKWDMAYLARYSPRTGTVSQKFFADDVSRAEKSRRWHVLNDLLKISSGEYNKKLIGRTLEVLVEKYDPRAKECEGKSRENKVVQFAVPAEKGPKLIGSLQKVEITKALAWNLKGRREAQKARSVPKK